MLGDEEVSVVVSERSKQKTYHWEAQQQEQACMDTFHCMNGLSLLTDDVRDAVLYLLPCGVGQFGTYGLYHMSG